MRYKGFNINHEVKVRVTEKGYQVWLEHSNQFVKYSSSAKSTTLEELKSKEDEGGWVEFQMWDMMNIFGRHMVMGFDNVIDPNILIDIEN